MTVEACVSLYEACESQNRSDLRRTAAQRREEGEPDEVKKHDRDLRVKVFIVAAEHLDIQQR